jgi:hypothetical protein
MCERFVAGISTKCREASILSRGAATDPSHGRKPVVRVSVRTEPRRGERSAGTLSPLRSSSSHWSETHGLAPVARIWRRSPAQIGCASRDLHRHQHND